MASNLTIIENTDEAREEYGTLWGINYINISEEDIKALYERKMFSLRRWRIFNIYNFR